MLFLKFCLEKRNIPFLVANTWLSSFHKHCADVTELWFLSSLKNAASFIKSLLSVTVSHYVQLSWVTSLETAAESKEKLSISAMLEVWLSWIVTFFSLKINTKIDPEKKVFLSSARNGVRASGHRCCTVLGGVDPRGPREAKQNMMEEKGCPGPPFSSGIAALR